MGREPKLIVACGRKGVGKTYTTMQYIRDYVRGNPASGRRGRKVLIFDVNDEYSVKQDYPDIRAISLKDIRLFSAQPRAEIRRVAPFFDDGRRMTLDDMAEVLMYIVQNFSNGLLLIEDINKYVSDSMPSDLIGAICTNRHTGVDIMVHYQSIGRLTPKIWQNINVMRMHKNTDSVDRHKNKFEDKYEYMKLAEKIIDWQMNKGNNRFYLFVDFDTAKIQTTLSPQEIKECVVELISDNYNLYVAPLLNKRVRSGERQYTPEAAMDAAEKRLLDLYFP